MESQILIAVLAFCGTLVGTLAGIVTSARLTNFRLEQLEEKVNKHNRVVEKTYILTERVENAVGRITGLERRE